jgi:hypothetical protein
VSLIRFHEDRALGANQSLTREGFLVCKDVPIARTGVMIYVGGEVPGLIPARDGLIEVERTPEVVFCPNSIASFEGKPVTMDHPEEDVDPTNWKRLAVGTVMNVRRGEGFLKDSLVADLFITDKDAIRVIRSGDKRQVSCGYDATYDQIEPGFGRQSSVVGNHVAIVNRGRCGESCRIGDTEMTELSWTEKVQRAFRTGDAKAFNAAIKDFDPAELAKKKDDAKDPAAPPPATDKPDATGVHHHITVNVGKDGNAAADAADPAAADPSATQPTAEAAADPIGVLTDAITQLMARIDALETMVKGKSADDPTSQDDPTTYDSASIVDEYHDVLSRAELLVPGIRFPTYDAKADPKATLDGICAFRRRALDAAYVGDRGRELMSDFYDGKTSMKLMTCDAVKVLFNAASSKARDANNSHSSARDHEGVKKGILSIADINKRNREVWAKNAN